MIKLKDLVNEMISAPQRQETPQERAKELSNTSTPDPFNVEFFIYVQNPKK